MKKLAKTALIGSLLATTVACSEENKPFTAKEVTPATDTATPADAKVSEAKCGEGKCGGASTTASADGKAVEAKCGEGKCGGSK